MKKLVLTTFMSLDGVFEEPGNWSMPYWNEETAKFKTEEFQATEALLLGRITYEGFAAAWPARSGDEFSDRMNSIRKYVVSTTLTNPSWQNTQVITSNVAEEIAKLKEGDGGDLLLSGSGVLTRSLLPYGLIDEYRILLYPILLGAGKRLFPGGSPETKLTLVESKAFQTGVNLLIYHPTKDA